MKAIIFLRDKLGDVCSWLSTAFLAYTVLIIVLEVILRYIFGHSIVWSGASARYCTIWSVMFMASVLVKDDDLIRADFFDQFLPKGFLKIRDVIYQLITAVIFALLFYFGLQFAKNGSTLKITFTNVSIFWAYLAVPVGAALMAIQFILRTIVQIHDLITGEHNDPRYLREQAERIAREKAIAEAEAEAAAVEAEVEAELEAEHHAVHIAEQSAEQNAGQDAEQTGGEQ